jgi:uncharacterized protein YegL
MSSFESQGGRRLPAWILADTSGSMSGEPITQVNQGLQFIKQDLEDDPRASEMVHLGLITFGPSASVRQDLVEIGKFQPPVLVAGGGTPMGDAFTELGRRIDQGRQPGDYRPMVFVLTDGEPDGGWEGPLQALKSRPNGKIADFVAIGCGAYVNSTTLKTIAPENAYVLPDLGQNGIARLMKWISSSLKAASDPANQANRGGAAPLAQTPGGVNVL